MEEEILLILKDLQPSYDFEEGVDFIEEGYLDSFDIVTSVTELEEKFSVTISALEIIPENFGTVKSIAELVKKSKKV